MKKWTITVVLKDSKPAIRIEKVVNMWQGYDNWSFVNEKDTIFSFRHEDCISISFTFNKEN